MLIDSFGRKHRDLRISLTDRCNLRCTYCLPAEGIPWLPKGDLLTTDELIQIASVAVNAGIEEIRLTGGEPLLRPDVVEIVSRLTQLAPKPELSMTTNAIRLARLAGPLKDAGLSRFNISLDTLDPQTFVTLTRKNKLGQVLDGIQAVAEAGFQGTKINSVLIRGLNDHEAPNLVRWAGENSLELRFIEQMPLDAGHSWSRANMVTTAEVFEQLCDFHTLDVLPGRGPAPAERYLVDGGPQVIGFVSSVTRPFCGACDRLRLTADGQLRNCLFASDETDLRVLVRSGDPDIVGAIEDCLTAKEPGHGINDPSFLQPKRPMSAIGG